MVSVELPEVTPLLLGGRHLDSTSAGNLVTINPAMGSAIGSVAQAGKEELEAAVVAARVAFDDGRWSRIKATDRGKILRRMADIIDSRMDALLLAECTDSGKPVSKAGGEMQEAVATFEFFAGAADKQYGETIPLGEGLLDFTLKEPVGVCALIVPWNFPFLMAVRKVAPALAAGCSVILKPASNTPLTALMLGDIATEAGMPEGVISVLPGSGATVGTWLVQHPLVDKIAFTGETVTGRNILKLAAETIKDVSLELGGKSPTIIFDDANIEAAIAAAIPSAFANSGQTCTARTRLFVQEGAYDRVVAGLIEQTPSFLVGDPMEKSTKMGPLISESHLDRVSGYIDTGSGEGAELVYGGSRMPAAGPAFLEPTIFAGVRNSMRIAQEEIFGPVLAVIPFKDEQEAIALANDSQYGLAASVWTGNGGRALRVSKALQVGMVSVNSNGSGGVLTPFGGYKQSGLGRELSMEGLSLYTQTKNVYYALNG
ncbi:MAG: aldehyde dehydrogenase [Thermomicrobiales bacterium]|nr:aldehyde dehydrogenase [Thermomicrobiales bacterium]